MIKLKFEIDPVPKGRPRLGKYGNVYTPPKTAQFEKMVGFMARAQLSQLRIASVLLGPLELISRFYLIPPKRCPRKLPTVKPDLDNLQKAIMDSLNEIVWKDDAQICISRAEKIYDWTAVKGWIEIVVIPMEVP